MVRRRGTIYTLIIAFRPVCTGYGYRIPKMVSYILQHLDQSAVDQYVVTPIFTAELPDLKIAFLSIDQECLIPLCFQAVRMNPLKQFFRIRYGLIMSPR